MKGCAKIIVLNAIRVIADCLGILLYKSAAFHSVNKQMTGMYIAAWHHHGNLIFAVAVIVTCGHLHVGAPIIGAVGNEKHRLVSSGNGTNLMPGSVCACLGVDAVQPEIRTVTFNTVIKAFYVPILFRWVISFIIDIDKVTHDFVQAVAIHIRRYGCSRPDIFFG